LRADTQSVVARHVEGCADCGGEVARLQRARVALATLAEREVEVPAFLVDSIVEAVEEHRGRRMLPIPPLAVADLAHVLTDHREAIASAAGTALVAAGAAYAVWRAVRARPSPKPATS
jgi:hypothetical protein